MLTISTDRVSTFIRDVAVRNREPVMLWGGPGIGKTDLVSEATRKVRKEDDGITRAASHFEEIAGLVPILVSQYESVDLRGIPSVLNNTTVWNMPSTLPFMGNPAFDHLSDDKPIVLFLDEVNAANPALYAVLYQLICNRRIGEHVLRHNVVIVCAGNREGDRGITNRMPLPLANRLVHAEVVVSVDYWCMWATKVALPAIGPAFIQFRKNLLNTFDPSKPDKSFATPRSWVKALKFFADEEMADDVKDIAISGAIGEGPASEFKAFVTVWQKVQGIVPRILKDPDGTPLPDEDSLCYALAIAVSGTMDAKNAATFHRFLIRMRPELCVLAWTLAVTRDKNIYASPAFIDFSKKYKLIFS